MIVFVIKSFFYSGADSYSLRRKSHTSYFVLPFCGEMIRVICAILAIVIEDLEVHLRNSNLFPGKNVIWFELSAQKREIDKQMAGTLYYQY